MLIALLASLSFGADCRTPATPADLDAALDAAETAFGELRIPDFLEVTERLQADLLPCQDAALTPERAARVHRVVGLAAFGARDVYAVQAFAAARSLDPAYTFPSSLVPEVSPIRDDFHAMSLDAARTQTLPAPVEGTLVFDGTPSTERPLSWGTIVQHVGEAGSPLQTAYLRPDDPMFEYRAIAAELPDTGARSSRLFGDAPPALVGGALGAALLGAGLYTGAGLSHAQWSNADTSDPDALGGMRTRTNALTVGAGVAGVAAVGLGVGVGLTW